MEDAEAAILLAEASGDAELLQAAQERMSALKQDHSREQAEAEAAEAEAARERREAIEADEALADAEEEEREASAQESAASRNALPTKAANRKAEWEALQEEEEEEEGEATAAVATEGVTTATGKGLKGWREGDRAEPREGRYKAAAARRAAALRGRAGELRKGVELLQQHYAGMRQQLAGGGQG